MDMVELSVPGNVLYQTARTYLAEGGSSSEFVTIFARIISEFNLNDGAGTETPVRESAIPLMSPAPSPKPSAPAHREPTSAQRSVAGAIAKEVAATVFDTIKTRDGRAWGDVRYGELNRMRTGGLKEAFISNAILKHGRAAHDAPVRHIMKSKAFALIVKNAEKKYAA